MAPDVRSYIHKCLQSLWKVETKELLVSRIPAMAEGSALLPKSYGVRVTHTRWGSCGPDQSLNFSAYLAPLPDALVDYVLWHEWVHLEHKHHGAEFWRALEKALPGAKALDQSLNRTRPGQVRFVLHHGQRIAFSAPAHKSWEAQIWNIKEED